MLPCHLITLPLCWAGSQLCYFNGLRPSASQAPEALQIQSLANDRLLVLIRTQVLFVFSTSLFLLFVTLPSQVFGSTTDTGQETAVDPKAL